MAKARVQYQCTSCGALSSKWTGQCGDCAAWNTLTESLTKDSEKKTARGYAGSEHSHIMQLSAVRTAAIARQGSGLDEFDRVLGGGIVPGSVVLIGGDPGIGKSTLLLQVAKHVAQDCRVLTVTGEESLQQVALRAQRLGLDAHTLSVLTETHIESIMQHVQDYQPTLLVIDSIQTLFTDQLSAAPGSVSQVRETAAILTQYAKANNTVIFLIGHVTKEGTIAGPRVLEHMVDTVLYFEGQTDSPFRLIRAIKNRFGAVNEIGLFAMTEQGLKAVNNPSAIFLGDIAEVAGNCVTVTWEGTRPLLIEVQALVDESHHGQPKRLGVGLDANRLALCLAVMHRHAKVATYDKDVFVNVVGGVKISETAADLAYAMATLASMRDSPLPQHLVCFGELGLAGEIRPVQAGLQRLKEAKKHGFDKALFPKRNMSKQARALGIQLFPVDTLSAAVAVFEQW